jgi:hypothetical protein
MPYLIVPLSLLFLISLHDILEIIDFVCRVVGRLYGTNVHML